MKDTLSELSTDLLIQIAAFLLPPTSLLRISNKFHTLENQEDYWPTLLCEHFSKFVNLKQLNENKIETPGFKKIYYLLSRFTQEERSGFKYKHKLGWIQTNLDSFIHDVKQDIKNFPWACYIQGSLLKDEGHEEKALKFFEIAAKNLSSARKMMAYIQGLEDQQSQLLLESAVTDEKDPQAAESLGTFFESQKNQTDDSNLINAIVNLR